MPTQLEIATQLEREERKIHNWSINIGRRQREIIEGISARELRIILTEHALKRFPDRKRIAA